MTAFEELAASRRRWIEEVLRPWCRTAARKELRQADLEWVDLAGKVAPEKSLWAWAWSRFPALVHCELASIDETAEVLVTLRDGRQYCGYPDARQSEHGQLVLAGSDADGPADLGPFSIDDIRDVEKR